MAAEAVIPSMADSQRDVIGAGQHRRQHRHRVLDAGGRLRHLGTCCCCCCCYSCLALVLYCGCSWTASSSSCKAPPRRTLKELLELRKYDPERSTFLVGDLLHRARLLAGHW